MAHLNRKIGIPSFDMTGKTAIITGGTQGLGFGMACALAAYGANVVITARTASKVEDAVADLNENYCKGGRAFGIPADSSKLENVKMVIEKTVEEFGALDILINNAGIAQQKLFTDITNEDWNAMVGVNLSGVFYCCRAALPYMIRQKAGSIVNVSSMWGICGASCEVHYSAVKAGVIGLTKALAKEVGPSGIRVNCIAPGAIATRMNDNLDEEAVALLREETPLGRMGTPEEIAKAIAFLALEDSAFTTGQVLSPNGGLVI